MDSHTDRIQGTSTLHHSRLHTAHTFWCASVWRLPRSGALPTRANAALLSRTVASAHRHKRIVGCGSSGGAAYHAWSTSMPNLFHSEGTYLLRHYYSYYCCYHCRSADTVIPFWELSALVSRLEIPESKICLIMTSYFAVVLPIHMQQRLMPQVQILVYAEGGFA